MVPRLNANLGIIAVEDRAGSGVAAQLRAMMGEVRRRWVLTEPRDYLGLRTARARDAILCRVILDMSYADRRDLNQRHLEGDAR
jgi:hypothetical protein